MVQDTRAVTSGSGPQPRPEDCQENYNSHVETVVSRMVFETSSNTVWKGTTVEKSVLHSSNVGVVIYLDGTYKITFMYPWAQGYPRVSRSDPCDEPPVRRGILEVLGRNCDEGARANVPH